MRGRGRAAPPAGAGETGANAVGTQIAAPAAGGQAYTWWMSATLANMIVPVAPCSVFILNLVIGWIEGSVSTPSAKSTKSAK